MGRIPTPSREYIWGSQGGVFAESLNRIYLANRGELKLPDRVLSELSGNWGFFNQQAATQPIANMVNCIVVVDGNGKLIEAWNQWDKLFDWGRDRNQVTSAPRSGTARWVVDDMRHVIYKFTHDGKRLRTDAQRAGRVRRQRRPDTVAPSDDDRLAAGWHVLRRGRLRNTRVVKFNKDGKPLMKWGTRGTGPGQFNTPHGIAVGGSPPRVFVSDRGNRRIQVFDVNGNFLEEWPGIAPHSMMMSADEHVWAVDSISDRIVKFDLSGHVEYSFGQFGTRPGYTWAMHQISADQDGNLFIAEVFGGRTPSTGRDRAPIRRSSCAGRSLMPMAGGTR